MVTRFASGLPEIITQCTDIQLVFFITLHGVVESVTH